MFRPYCAIITDSFREAFASRVLWILLILITGVLLGLAPLGYQSKLVTGLSVGDIRDWPELITTLAGDEGTRTSPQGRIWTLLDPATKELMKSLSQGLQRDPSGELADDSIQQVLRDLRSVMADEGLYDEFAWEGIELNEEAEDLLRRREQGLSAGLTQRLNRLLLERAFPEVVRTSRSGVVELSCLGWSIPQPWPLQADQLQVTVKYGISLLMTVFLKFISIIVAVLVTAPIVPKRSPRDRSISC